MVPRKVRICLYESAHRSGIAWWIEDESKRHRVENGRYLLIDGRWGSRVGDGLHRYPRYEANTQQVLRESAGVICPLGVGTSRGNDICRCLRCEDNARYVPRWGAGVVDSLRTDSRRGAASYLATIAPSPPPTARRVAGQTRMLLFRHGGKTSSSSPPPSELTTIVVAVALRGEEYHVVAAIEGHELETPEAEHRPGLKRLLKTTHLELNGKVFVNMQQAPYLARQLSAFRTRGSLDRPVNLSQRAPAQMGWRKMEHKGKMRLVLSRTRGVLVVGVTSVARERERACSLARSPARPPSPRRKALDLCNTLNLGV
jgi:hypothetical protein